MQDRPSGAPPSGHWDANVAVREPVQDVAAASKAAFADPPAAGSTGVAAAVIARLGRLARFAYDLLTRSP